MSAPQLPQPFIDDYGVIGNLHTAALVGLHGSIDFLCYPRFDSPSLFARLLDDSLGGSWSIIVDHPEVRSTQTYEPDTAILVTRHATPEGAVEVEDFMPPVDDITHCQVVRRVRIIAGKVDIISRFDPRYPYAKQKNKIKVDGSDPHTFTIELEDEKLHLFSSLEADTHAKTTLSFRTTLQHQPDKAHEQLTFVLQSEQCKLPQDGLSGFGESLYQHTKKFWTNWSSKLTYTGEHRNLVRRSALMLKLCTSAEYGSSVAAITFGLPESLGGSLNWDYRYTWIRDSAFSMYAMLRLGLTDEASAFIEWIVARCEEMEDAADLKLMYRVDGGTDLDESALEHLAGYRNSQPVRIGNGAQDQRQLDIYGELIDTVYLYDRFGQEITYNFWQSLVAIIDHVCETWDEPDHGIWEAREGKYQYTMSKVMAWVAIDRGLRIAEHRGFPAPYERWRKERDELYTAIYSTYYNKQIGAWTEYADSDCVDGSVLLMPLIRFVTTREPEWQSTLEVVERELVRDSLVYRYSKEGKLKTGFDGTEGFFSMCGCWYVEVLAKSGRVGEARAHLAKLASHANHLGLFSEEIAMDGQQIGNFPQAFTHLAFISAALQIEEQLKDECAGAESGPKG